MTESTSPGGETSSIPAELQNETVTTPRRFAAAQVLAFVALVASLVGAVGPAEHLQSTYSWPSEDLGTETPSRMWYTPLLLVRHRPDAISATIPCSLPPALPAADRPITVLATARFPETAGGLAVLQEGQQVVIRVGEDVLQRFVTTEGNGDECAYRLKLGGSRWSLEGGPGMAATEGGLDEMPTVTGLFSALDLSAGTGPTVAVTTAVHAADTSVRQSIAWILAVACAIAALGLVSFDRERRRRPRVRPGLRRALAHAHGVDAVVGAVLLGWWVLSPAFVDDGWVFIREQMFEPSGGFSVYYNTLGANIPNDYWPEWLHHWLSESTSALLLLRVTALASLAATWVLCRWILSRVLGGQPAPVALWSLAAAFLTGALAWGMTMRPEPVTALLATASLAGAVAFVTKPRAAPLAAAAVVLPLAVTAHHAGIAALAPLVAASPSILRWARARVGVASTLGASSIALLATLLFVGSDLELRRTDADLNSTYGPAIYTWRDEITRYASLSEYPAGTPLRRASVALIALVLLSFVMRRRRGEDPVRSLPAIALATALLLFVAAPTKLAWHFGALLGIAAVAVAREAARLQEETRSQSRWAPRSLIAIGAAVVAIAWSWSVRENWNTLDLKVLDWTLGFEARTVALSTLAALLPIVVLVVASLSARSHSPGSLPRVPARVASWAAPLLAAPLIAFTAGVLVTDALKTEGWTLLRQNVDTLAGRLDCGLADTAVVRRTSSSRPLATVGRRGTSSAPAWVPPAPIAGLATFALGPTSGDSGTTPWFRLRDNREPPGIYLSGNLDEADDLALEWGRVQAGRVEPIVSGAISPTFATGTNEPLVWRFAAREELPAQPPGVDAVRVTFRRGTPLGSAVAVTAPVTYASTGLRERLRASSGPTLVFGHLLMYFPCAVSPVLSDGVVQPPRYVITAPNVESPTGNRRTSPFEGALDLYSFDRLPVTDETGLLADVVVYEVDGRIPGAVRTPPEKTISAS